MDLPWGDEKTVKFATNVGLITSNGPGGHNIMAAEWTHHVSYSPGLVMVNVGYSKMTEENILATKEFGISIAAEDQNIASSVAGMPGRQVDKIKILQDLGVEFYDAKKINVKMVKGAVLNLECRLIKAEKIGDHHMFIGEILEATSSGKKPLVYHGLKYWRLGEQIQKPDQKLMDKIEQLKEKHKKK